MSNLRPHTISDCSTIFFGQVTLISDPYKVFITTCATYSRRIFAPTAPRASSKTETRYAMPFTRRNVENPVLGVMKKDYLIVKKWGLE